MKLGRKKPQNSTRARNRGIADQRTAVYSYYRAKEKDADNSDLPKRKKKPLPSLKKIVYAVVLLAALISLIYFSFLKQTDVKIDNVDENTTAIRNQDDYTRAVDGFVKSSILNRSKFTFDISGLTKKLKQDFPEVQTVDVATDILTNTLHVSVNITKPVFALESGGKVAIVGENGVTLSVQDNSAAASLGNLKRVIDSSGIEPVPGKPAFPKEQTLFVAIINEQLEKQGMSVESLTVTTSPYDLNVKLTGKNYYVKFNVLEDPLQQVGALIAFIKNQESRGEVPAEYIDVRVSERLYYK